MRYLWATATHVGNLRKVNEDSVHPEADGKGAGPIVVAVADGMGGHAAGDVASRVAIETAVTGAGEDMVAAQRVAAANEAVLGAVTANQALSGMGTTMTLAIFDADGVMHVGHVGDSRAYLLREGELSQITTDHTLVAELVAMGRLTPEAALNHPRRHMVTRALGTPNVEVDAFEMTVLAGDRVLLCSDGLTGMVRDVEIARIVRDFKSPEAAAWSLVEAANSAGGADNTTVAVVDVIA
jgi:protein phosphatase